MTAQEFAQSLIDGSGADPYAIRENPALRASAVAQVTKEIAKAVDRGDLQSFSVAWDGSEDCSGSVTVGDESAEFAIPLAAAE